MFVSHLQCPKCGKSFESEKRVQVCACGSPLLVRYDLKKVGQVVRKEDLMSRKPDLWRYRELLPVKDPANIVNLGEGMTPLLH